MTAPRPARKIRDIDTFFARQSDKRFWRRFHRQMLMRIETSRVAYTNEQREAFAKWANNIGSDANG